MGIRNPFGHDVFLSYSHADAGPYAEALARQLTDKDFSCYLDQWSTTSNEELPWSLRHALGNSGVLVLIGTSGAIASSAVEAEVREFSTTGRTIIPIDVDDVLARAPWSKLIIGLHRTSEKSEALQDGRPSGTVVDRIENSITLIRRNTRVRWTFIGLGMLVFVGSIVAIYEGYRAIAAAQEAEKQQSIAEEKTRVAEIKTEEARVKTEEARVANELANRNRALANLRDIETKKQRRIARSGELAAQSMSLFADRLDLSLLLSVEALRVADTFEARSALAAGLQRTGWIMTVLRGHNGGVESIAFSPDGRTYASGASDGTIMLWDATRFRPIAPAWKSHDGAVRSLLFRSDSSALIAGGEGGTVRVWSLRQPAQPAVERVLQTGNKASIDGLLLTPKRRLIGRSDNGRIWLWDLETGNRQDVTLEGRVFKTAFSPNGRFVATGALDGGVRVWDLVSKGWTSEPVRIGSHEISSLAFNGSGKQLAFSSMGGIGVWNFQDSSARTPQVLRDSEGSKMSLVFSPNDAWLASGSTDRITAWSTDNEWPFISLPGPLDVGRTLAFAPDSHTLISGSCAIFSLRTDCSEGVLRVWDLDRPQQLAREFARDDGVIGRVAFSPDGAKIASGDDKGVVRLRATEATEREGSVRELRGSQSVPVTALSFNADGRQLAVGFDRSRIEVWNLDTSGASVRLYKTDFGDVQDLHFGPARDQMLSAHVNVSGETTIVAWNLVTREGTAQAGPQARSDERNRDKVRMQQLAFSPDGRLLAAGDVDREDNSKVVLWSTQTHRTVGVPMTGRARGGVTVAFNPQGTVLAASGVDDSGQGRITLFDPATQRPIGLPFTGHEGVPNSIALSPDGRILAASTIAVTPKVGQTSMLLWDVNTRRIIGVPMGGPAGFTYSVKFDARGRRLASGGEDRRVLIWDVHPESWKALACRIANRNLTTGEMINYLGAPGAPTCPGARP